MSAREELLAALEAVTGEMLAVPAEEIDCLLELAGRRGRLAARLGPLAAAEGRLRERLERVIAAGDEIEIRVRKVMAMLESEIARADREDRFARELRTTVPAAPNLLDLRA